MTFSLDPDGGQMIPTPDYEPTEQDIDYLNRIDAGYIGYDKPEVELTIDYGKDLWVLEDGKIIRRYVPEEELHEYTWADGDNDPADPAQNWS